MPWTKQKGFFVISHNRSFLDLYLKALQHRPEESTKKLKMLKEHPEFHQWQKADRAKAKLKFKPAS
jgi:hypothetical protein